MEISVFKTAAEACGQLASCLAGKTKQCTTIALSGGSTPKLLFRIMAEKYKDTDWSKCRFFWVDERMAPQEAEESNFGEFYRILVTSGIVPESVLYPIKYNADEARALAETEAVIRTHVPFVNELPQFDLIVLGIGEDGHTASIFPGHLQSFESKAAVELAVHPQTGQHRITLTGSVLNNARNVIFLCTGAGKKEILHEVIQKKNPVLPATHVSPSSGHLAFYLDEAAASLR